MIPFQDDKYLRMQRSLIDQRWHPFQPTNEDLARNQRLFLWKEKKRDGWYFSMYMVVYKMMNYQTYETSVMVLQEEEGDNYNRMLHLFRQTLIAESNKPENLF